MTLQLADFVGLGATGLAAAVLVFLRVGALVAMVPLFGEQVLPARVKLAVALALTAVVAPAITPVPPQGPGGWLAAGASEVVAGLALGFGARLFVMVLLMTAEIAAQATSLAQMAGGMAAEPQPAIGNVLMLAGLALAAAAGLHVRIAALLILSYDAIPPGRLAAAADLSRWSLERTGAGFALAVSLAAPFLGAALLYNLALGVLSRAMPQLMISLIGAPALTLGALALLALAAGPALGLWQAAFAGFLAAPFGGGP